MQRCPECRQENPEEARFCNACATPLGAEAPERRKLATLLFCDMSGSTAMGERVDAESVRDMMFAYFHEMRGAIERHGGMVEKFIGDAVMGVFGVPTAHEDDALRAVRAAWEMQERLASLNEELERRFGSRIALRMGVNTGEVVAGDSTSRQAVVTGDAVNVAARLEQAAFPGQVLIGAPTYSLVRDAVSVEPVEPLSLKGKSEPMPAYRLTHVQMAAPARARRLDTPMVGRQQELAQLRGTLSEAARGHGLLVTVVGEPGVGKSRLAAELLTSAEDEFQILSGRCLQYGEGITYWPIAEIVRQAAGIRDEHSRDEALGRIRALIPGDEAAVVAQAIGLIDGQASTQEIAAAIHGLLRALARRRPLLVFLDDIHWAEAALLELLAAIPAQVQEAPLLLLCLARPELVEEQPQWEVTVRLQPLEEADSTALVGQLLGEAALPAGLAERISNAAAGNPLFVEELVGMVIDDGLLERRNGSWVADPGLAEFTIPPTLRELLGARLDRMSAGERSALERGAVEGQVFHRGAVLELSEEEQRPQVHERLQALLDREYIRSARAEFADESAFRVRHILIRDAAYEGIPKKLRAMLHERFADWLEEKAGERASEYEEILGYHLEQAYGYREELGPVGEGDLKLARRAADKLGAAGHRAFARRDANASVKLLSRAATLLPKHDSVRLAHLQAVGEMSLEATEFERANTALLTVREEATASGDHLLVARAELYLGFMKLVREPEYGGEKMLAELERIERVFEEAADHRNLAHVHDIRAWIYDIRRESAALERAAEEGLRHARLAGDRRLELELQWWLLWSLPEGPRPVEEAIERCYELLHQVEGDQAAESVAYESLARLEAMRGRFEEARGFAESSIAIRHELGLIIFVARTRLYRGVIELMAGNPAAAQRDLRRALEDARHRGETEVVSKSASWLAEALYADGDPDGAEPFVLVAREAATPDSVATQTRWRAIAAKLEAKRGRHEAGETLVRDALALARPTDDLNLQADMTVALADVLALAARADEASGALEEAFELYERKGNIVSAGKTRKLLEELRHSARSRP